MFTEEGAKLLYSTLAAHRERTTPPSPFSLSRYSKQDACQSSLATSSDLMSSSNSVGTCARLHRVKPPIRLCVRSPWPSLKLKSRSSAYAVSTSSRYFFSTTPSPYDRSLTRRRPAQIERPSLSSLFVSSLTLTVPQYKTSSSLYYVKPTVRLRSPLLPLAPSPIFGSPPARKTARLDGDKRSRR